ncbi:MAG: flagellar motor protein MotB [Planctomycetota bacterium]|nr:flagellar motor protein MotB [Planctomycetota bacterium]
MAAEKQKPQEEEGGEGAPLWIISFADMISLLMAFFVMLSTFSSFGPAESAKLTGVARAALAPNYGWYSKHPRESMGKRAQTTNQTSEGSEKPTLEKQPNGKSIAPKESKDFKTHKVFLIESKKIFWSGGTTLSAEGRKFLNTFAFFAKKLPGRIVISENGPGNDADLGIYRSIVVVEHLGRNGISKGRCNIAAKGTLPDENFKAERMLEITLLDESTYK